jgi:hypothetical protein
MTYYNSYKVLKCTIFICFILFDVSFLKSQPVLTYEDLKLELGKKYFIAASDQMINQGDSGENIIWDFSNLYEMVSHEIIVAESDSNFPQANFNLVNEGNSYSYYFEDSNGRYAHGVHYITFDLKVEYDKPGLTLFYPLEFGKTMYDTFSGHYEAGGHNTISKGTTFFNCDAYGTVTTPYKTFNNAIRIYSKQVSKDSSAINNVTTEVESYSWHVEGYAIPVVSISIIVTSMGTFYNASYLKDPTINIHKIDQTAFNYKLYPNPTSNNLNLEYDHTTPITSVEIVDLAGKHIQNIKLNNASDSGKLKIEVSELTNGLYFLKMTTSEGIRSAKFTVSR